MASATLLRRIRRRRQRRGAAATEAALIATFFVFIFACMWGALSFHHEKVRVMKEARANAWVHALNSCDGGSGASTVGGGSDVMGDIASNAPTTGANPPPASGQQNVPKISDSALNEEKGYASASVTGSVTMSGIIGGASYTPVGKMYIRCNEDPPPDNILDFAKQAFKIAKGLWPF